MDRPDWAPGEIDLDRPSVARVYDYYLGGAHNFAADRAAAKQVLDAMPELKGVVLTNRAFLRRAVRYLTSIGVRQFLDLGSGIPTVGNVHEVASQTDPGTRVVYVDHDSVAVAHGRALLADNPQVRMLQADVRDPADVLGSAEVKDLLDLSEPVAVLMIAVLHFVPEDQDPTAIIAGYRDALVSGSHLALSHAGVEEDDDIPGWQQARTLYDQRVSPMTYRSRAQVSALFAGWELVDPGVVRLPLWRPESPDEVAENAAAFPGYAAVGRLP